MKRTILIAVMIALFTGASAQAQVDSLFFNHVAAGLTLGVDGIGAQVAVPVTPFLQLRAGYATGFPIKVTGNFGTHEMDNGHLVHLNSLPITTWPYKGGLGQLFVDFFPGKKEVLRISAGLFAGGGKFLSLKADMRESMASEDYTVLMAKGDVRFSTDEEGYGYADVLTWKVLPYFGIGTGKAVSSGDKRFVFTFDAGVAFTGGMKIHTYDFSSGSKEPCPVTSAATVDEDGVMLDNGLIDLVTGIPVLPVIKIGLFYKIF